MPAADPEPLGLSLRHVEHGIGDVGHHTPTTTKKDGDRDPRPEQDAVTNSAAALLLHSELRAQR